MNPFDEKTQSAARRAAQVLNDLGATAYLVGGSARDAILGKTTRDVDIVVSGSANRVGEALAESLSGHFVRLHPDFDVARVIVQNGDHRTTIDLLSLTEDGIDSDLRLRDFTVNAIATPLESVLSGDWKLIDPLGGVRDIRQETIVYAPSRTTFSATTRFDCSGRFGWRLRPASP